MALVRRNQTALRIQRLVIQRPLPSYQRLILGLFLGILFTFSGALTLTRLVQPSSNPFAAYTNMLPDKESGDALWSNPKSLIALFRSRCPDASERSDCRYTLTSGPIKSVAINPPYKPDEPSGIYLSVHEGTLQVGDLSVLWGKPTVTTYPDHHFLVSWPRQQITTMVLSKSGLFSFFLPIQYLYLTIQIDYS